MEHLIENLFSQAMTEVGKGSIGGCLEKVEVAKKTEPGVIA